jgi:UDP-N-acetylmuramoyl-L-alanyl-D-glutamate--2,6-diaminopimelate ligase
MLLGHLTDGLVSDFCDSRITGFAIDHRKVAPGTVFGAFKGSRHNGEDFIEAAISAGAIAVVASKDVTVRGAAHIVSDNPRLTFAELAARFFAPFPAKLAAVTGTNGKTSTAELSRQLWRMSGKRAASIGTLGVVTADDQISTGMTTPDVVTFLANLSGLAREGISHIIFEATSHGLDQYRVAGVTTKTIAFTNLSRDHLDYHGTMDAYFEAKMRLFDEIADPDATAVIWADDSWSERTIERARRRDLNLLTVGETGNGIKLLRRTPTQLGQDLHIMVQNSEYHIKLPLIGAYQAANALLAAGVVIASGGSVERTIDDLARLQPVRGRLERACIAPSGAPVYVDFAHTPDGLDAAISALRPHVAGQLILVFGAGGDRDSGKRPLMGESAARGADVQIITDDNPRHEDAASIRAAILAGAPNALEIADRRNAIKHAIAISTARDVVLIAGKGHEQGQIVGDQILPFDDVAVARECAE